MYAGMLAETGTTTELYHHPLHPYTRMLFSATPDLLANHEIRSIPGTPPRLDVAIEGCPFAPRCDSAVSACSTTRPPLRTAGPGHRAYCHVEPRT